MEEKKLTDEEIVKALAHCSHNRSCEYCYHNGEAGSGEIVCRARLMGKSLDFIHRLQDENGKLKTLVSHFEELENQLSAEIERLKIKNDELFKAYNAVSGLNTHLNKKRAELQKQVDELKNRRIEPKIFQCHGNALENCPKVEQAVKDTAKEILIPLIDCEKQIDPLQTGIRWSVLKGFCKKFGVEVE